MHYLPNPIQGTGNTMMMINHCQLVVYGADYITSITHIRTWRGRSTATEYTGSGEAPRREATDV